MYTQKIFYIVPVLQLNSIYCVMCTLKLKRIGGITFISLYGAHILSSTPCRVVSLTIAISIHTSIREQSHLSNYVFPTSIGSVVVCDNVCSMHIPFGV